MREGNCNSAFFSVLGLLLSLTLVAGGHGEGGLDRSRVQFMSKALISAFDFRLLKMVKISSIWAWPQSSLS